MKMLGGVWYWRGPITAAFHSAGLLWQQSVFVVTRAIEGVTQTSMSSAESLPLRTAGKSFERRWSDKNKRVGVSRFHAVDLNAHKYEFTGWTRQRAARYGRGLVRILQQQKRRLHVVSVGILANEYHKLISAEGRKKFGHPYIVRFKECVALLAEEMERWWEPEHTFSVVLEENAFQNEALTVFQQMKASIQWPPHRRLDSCELGRKSDHVALQPADLVAYETFRLIDEKHYGNQKVRKALESLFPHNGFAGLYYDGEILQRIKEPLETANCVENGFIVIHPPAYTVEPQEQAQEQSPDPQFAKAAQLSQ